MYTDVSEEQLPPSQASFYRTTRHHIPEDSTFHTHAERTSNPTRVEECYLLGYNAVKSAENKLTFRRSMSVPSSGSKNKPCKKPETA
jgi:hypothetical protein